MSRHFRGNGEQHYPLREYPSRLHESRAPQGRRRSLRATSPRALRFHRPMCATPRFLSAGPSSTSAKRWLRLLGHARARRLYPRRDGRMKDERLIRRLLPYPSSPRANSGPPAASVTRWVRSFATCIEHAVGLPNNSASPIARCLAGRADSECTRRLSGLSQDEY